MVLEHPGYDVDGLKSEPAAATKMPEFIEQLPVRNAELAEECPPLDARGWPEDAQLLNLRALPYPFNHYCSLSNDCDSRTGGSMEEVIAAFSFLRDELNLPVCDSFFPDMLCSGVIRHSPNVMPSDIPCTVRQPTHESFVERVGPYIRKHHLGWFDTIHGFVNAMAVRIPRTTAEHEIDEAADPAARAPGAPHRKAVRTLAVGTVGYANSLRFTFFVPAGWEVMRPPRYLLIEYAAPLQGTIVEIDLIAEGQSKTVIRGAGGGTATSLCTLQWYMIDLWKYVGLGRPALMELEVEVRVDGPPGVYVTISDLMQVNFTRGDLKRFSNVLSRYNMNATTFTSHGIGLVFAPAYAADRHATDERRLGDLPSNPHYAVDILWDLGVRFINTYTNTSIYSPLKLENLTFRKVLNDRRIVYDFHRYSYAPWLQTGNPDMSFWTRSGTDLNPSLVDTLGPTIQGFLRDVSRDSGLGGLIYTHLYATNKPDGKTPERVYDRPFNDDAKRALALLSDCYYNHSGTIAPKDRIFIAPQSTLLTMSVLKRSISDHGYYNQRTNVISIDSWFDEVVGQRIPNRANGYRELRGLTFYVADSGTARLIVDGENVEDLVRNPADESGTQSIMVVDNTAPVGLLGKVPFHRCRAKVRLQGLSIENTFYNNSSGLKFVLTSACGQVEVFPNWVSVSDYQFIRLKFRKSDPGQRLGIEIRFRSGLLLRAVERGIDVLESCWWLEPWHSTKSRVLIVPCVALVEHGSNPANRPTGSIPGIGIIESWTVTILGKTKGTFQLDSVQCLRDNDLPMLNDGVIVGGWADPILDLVKVRMVYEEDSFAAPVSTEGTYVFARKVRIGPIVEIYGVRKDGALIEPDNGKFVEILTNKTDIDFHLGVADVSTNGLVFIERDPGRLQPVHDNPETGAEPPSSRSPALGIGGATWTPSTGINRPMTGWRSRFRC